MRIEPAPTFDFQDKIILPVAYFGSVYYFSLLARYSSIFLEDSESYLRQTLRNRTEILSANGQQNLVIPVERGRSSAQPIKEVRIAYHTPWQKNHWRTLVSAYQNSPYFEHYETDVQVFFHRKFNFLFDLNIEITQLMLSLFQISHSIQYTEKFEYPYGSPGDLRYTSWPIREKAPFDIDYRTVHYTQVFEEKYKFISHLSILDLLFCEGPQGLRMLTAGKVVKSALNDISQ